MCSPHDGCSSFISAAVVKHPDSRQLREKWFVALTIQVTVHHRGEVKVAVTLNS